MEQESLSVAFTGTNRLTRVAPVDRPSDVSVGRVAEINIAANHEELPVAVERVRAVAGRGIEGDRNYLAEGDHDRIATKISP